MPMPIKSAMARTIVVNIMLTILISVVAFCFLPNNIAVHMNAQYHVDRWGSKWELFIPTVLTCLCQWFFFAFWSILGKADAAQKAAFVPKLIQWSFVTVCAIFSTISTNAVALIYTRTMYETNPASLFTIITFAAYFTLSAAIVKTLLNKAL